MTDPTPQSRPVAVPSGRMIRATRLSGLAASVATNMAVNGLRQLGQGQRPSSRDLVLTPANIRRVTDELARMRGAAMKIGQLLSMDTGDALPPELAEIMSRLRADADFMPPRQLKSVLSTAWGEGWLARFQTFDVRPIAAASIGQVHRATLKDGRKLAIKVQYPGIANSIDSDVKNVGALIRMSGLVPKGFDLAPYLEEARSQLRDEANYLKEAAYLADFHAILGDHPDFTLPEPILDLTSQTVLAMGFVEGTPIEAALEADQTTRDSIATRMIALTLDELFEHGLMQTDPNFANFRYHAQSDQIVLLDFGATRRFSPAIIALYVDLMRAGLALDRVALDRAATAIGFLDAETAPRFREQILDMMMLVFEATCGAGQIDFGTTNLSARLQVAGEQLSRDGFIPPPLPMETLYIQRKFAGMFLLATRLKARVPVKSLIETALVKAMER